MYLQLQPFDTAGRCAVPLFVLRGYFEVRQTTRVGTAQLRHGQLTLPTVEVEVLPVKCAIVWIGLRGTPSRGFSMNVYARIDNGTEYGQESLHRCELPLSARAVGTAAVFIQNHNL